MYGTLRPTTARTFSGWNRAVFQTIGAPQSWPTRIAWVSPRAAIRPANVGAHLLYGIGLFGLGLVTPTVAAHIGCGHAVAGFGEHRDLMAPGVPALGPAVHQQHQRSLAGQRYPQVDAIGGDGFEVGLRHCHCSASGDQLGAPISTPRHQS